MAVVKEIGIQTSDGSGYDTRQIGADAQNVDIALDSNGNAIPDVTAQGVIISGNKSIPQFYNETKNGLSKKAPIDHSSFSDEYGAASVTEYGHMKVGTGLTGIGEIGIDFAGSTDIDADKAVAANDTRLSDKRDPKAHANSDATVYGGGTANLYGHNMLSDNYQGTLVTGGTIYTPEAAGTKGAAGSISPSLYAVQSAYNVLNDNMMNVEFKNITADFNSGVFSANLAKYKPGNYIVKSNGNTNYAVMLAHYDYYYSHDYNNYACTNQHHWVAIVLGLGEKAINSTATTAGGFLGSNVMLPWLLGECKDLLLTLFGSSHLIAHQCLLSKGTYNASDTVNHGFTWDWQSGVYAMLMSEAQVYGTRAMGYGWFDVGEANRQLKIFQEKSFMEVLSYHCGQSNNNFNSKHAWLRDISALHPSAYFCDANYDGLATDTGASTSLGAFPIIMIK